MKQIRIFDLKFKKKEIDFFLKNSKNIFKEGFFTNHSYVKKFEYQFKKKISLNLHYQHLRVLQH